MSNQSISVREANPDNVNLYKEAHPELIIDDLDQHWEKCMEEWRVDIGKGNYGFNFKTRIATVLRLSMLCRGVNKWFKVRRDLIAYNNLIKHDILQKISEVAELKQDMQSKYVAWNHPDTTLGGLDNYHLAREKYLVAKELLKYITVVRGDLKNLTNTERWQTWYIKGKPVRKESMNTIKASNNETYETT